MAERRQTLLRIPGAGSRGQPWISLPRTQSDLVLKGFDGRQWAASTQSFTN